MQVRDGGVWKNVTPSARSAGVWKPVQEVWVRKSGAWVREWQNITPALTANMTVGLWTDSSIVSKGYDGLYSGRGSMSSRTISVPGKTFTLNTCYSKRNSGGAPSFSMVLAGTHTQADADLLNMHARRVFINGVLLQENTWNPATNTWYDPPVPVTPFWGFDAKYATVFYGGLYGTGLLNDPIDSVAQGTVLPVVIGN